MQSALYDEQQGYYCRQDLARWGTNGDYRTSPETTVLFATTFACYFAQLFVELRSPPIFTIIEVGCGSGQFAAQVLVTLHRRFPDIYARLNYVLDEISPDARMRATELLAGFDKKVQFKPLADLTIDGGIIFSNELIDAFPVHLIGLRNRRLVEFYVKSGKDGNFEWVDGPLSSPRLFDYLKRFGIQPVEGQVIEINLALEDWYREVAEKVKRGYVITVDYGAEAEELYGLPARKHGTLRAFYRHRISESVLNAPGEQDITSTIDWTEMKEIGRELGFELVEFERQDRFLLSHGLLEELELMIAEVESEAERMRLRTSAREMILPSGMAGSFQVLVQRKGI
jgi:SAM-dependent MidA family methyltransferase